ncbi:MAG TPA: zinc ribbon domain-containing protein [Candidatus Limnocylindrales bacterium]|nr:zinc ribbon domain-containing protein [Candidatus Limnocylindrales bacterium]
MTRPDPGLPAQGAARGLLRVAGPILLGLGVLLTAIAMIDFFGAMSSFGTPRNFWMGFVGLPLIAVGAALTKLGYLGPASRYVAGEITPTLRDTLGALGMGPARTVCAACGGENAADAKFCDDCGAPMQRTCARCNAANAADATFCDDCGTELRTA